MKTTKSLQDAIATGGPLVRLHAAMELAAHMDDYLPWLAAREFVGMTITRKTDEWLFVLKAFRGNKPEVCFFAAESLEEGYLMVAWAVLWDLAAWKADKWGTMRSDKT